MSSTSNQDPHKGGDLSEMAKDGTKIPGDAGRMNIIPSTAPTQARNDLGDTSLNTAADNPAGTVPADDNIVTGTGDSVPSSVSKKHF